MIVISIIFPFLISFIYADSGIGIIMLGLTLSFNKYKIDFLVLSTLMIWNGLIDNSIFG